MLFDMFELPSKAVFQKITAFFREDFECFEQFQTIDELLERCASSNENIEALLKELIGICGVYLESLNCQDEGELFYHANVSGYKAILDLQKIAVFILAKKFSDKAFKNVDIEKFYSSKFLPKSLFACYFRERASMGTVLLQLWMFDSRFVWKEYKYFLADSSPLKVKYENDESVIETHIVDGRLCNKASNVCLDGLGKFFLYVMDHKGVLYLRHVNPIEKEVFCHSSFLKGAPVICAGEIGVVNGAISYINNDSGHYRPRPQNI